jgi:hypothetical protein
MLVYGGESNRERHLYYYNLTQSSLEKREYRGEEHLGG